MASPTIVSNTPDYLVGQDAGYPVLVPVNAPDGARAPFILSPAQVSALTASVVDAAGNVLASGGALGPYTDLAALIAAKPAATHARWAACSRHPVRVYST